MRQQPCEPLLVELDGLPEDAQRRLVARGVLEVLQEEDLAQMAQEVADELRVFDTVVRETLHELERFGGASLDDDVGELEEQVGVGRAERLEDIGAARWRPRSTR